MVKIKVVMEFVVEQILVVGEFVVELILVVGELVVCILVVLYVLYGLGLVCVGVDGSGLQGWLVKGCLDIRFYYIFEDLMYDFIVVQVWFQDEELVVWVFFMLWCKSIWWI